MSDSIKPDDHQSGNANGGRSSHEAGRALMAGLLGGVASAVGYVIYSRLPEDQRDNLHRQVRALAESRLKEIRANLNF
jgi:hypothetical protein